MADFTGQTANICVKIPVGPTAQPLGSSRLGAVMNETMNLFAHLLEQIVEVLSALFPANDGAHIDGFAMRVIANLAKEQVASVQIFSVRPQQQEGAIRLEKALKQQG